MSGKVPAARGRPRPQHVAKPASAGQLERVGKRSNFSPNPTLVGRVCPSEPPHNVSHKVRLAGTDSPYRAVHGETSLKPILALCIFEPGKDAFHRVSDLPSSRPRKARDGVESVPTRFLGMESSQSPPPLGRFPAHSSGKVQKNRLQIPGFRERRRVIRCVAGRLQFGEPSPGFAGCLTHRAEELLRRDVCRT